MKKLLFSNWKIKLSSLALALVLWLSLYGGKKGFSFIRGGSKEFVVAVKILEPPVYPFQIRVDPDEVSLVLAGPRAALKKLTADKIALFVLVEGLKEGEYELYPRAYLPKEIRISRSRPETVRVILKANESLKTNKP